MGFWRTGWESTNSNLNGNFPAYPITSPKTRHGSSFTKSLKYAPHRCSGTDSKRTGDSLRYRKYSDRASSVPSYNPYFYSHSYQPSAHDSASFFYKLLPHCTGGRERVSIVQPSVTPVPGANRDAGSSSTCTPKMFDAGRASTTLLELLGDAQTPPPRAQLPRGSAEPHATVATVPPPTARSGTAPGGSRTWPPVAPTFGRATILPSPSCAAQTQFAF